MIKAVLDTNVIISGIITDHGSTYQILRDLEDGRFDIVSSEPIFQEIQRVLYYPHIKNKRHLTEERIESILNTLRMYAIITPSKIEISVVSEDPKDDMFVVAAIEGEAEYIVSGDHHLLDIKFYQEIKIVSPIEFLKILSLEAIKENDT